MKCKCFHKIFVTALTLSIIITIFPTNQIYKQMKICFWFIFSLVVQRQCTATVERFFIRRKIKSRYR